MFYFLRYWQRQVTINKMNHYYQWYQTLRALATWRFCYRAQKGLSVWLYVLQKVSLRNIVTQVFSKDIHLLCSYKFISWYCHMANCCLFPSHRYSEIFHTTVQRLACSTLSTSVVYLMSTPYFYLDKLPIASVAKPKFMFLCIHACFYVYIYACVHLV